MSGQKKTRLQPPLSNFKVNISFFSQTTFTLSQIVCLNTSCNLKASNINLDLL